MSFLTQLAEQFRAQRPAPPNPYSWPQLSRPSYADQGFQIGNGSDYEGTTPRVVQVRVPDVAANGSTIISNHRISYGIRMALGRNGAPGVSAFASIHPTKPNQYTEGNGGRREFDPYPDFAFKVNIEGITKNDLSGHFQKFDGFDLEVEAIEYKSGADAHVHKRPGVPKYSTIKLSKGLIDDRGLWDWCMKTARGDLERHNITITVLADTHEDTSTKPLVAYNFIGCWPSKWSGLRLDGKGQGTVVEDLEFVVDYIELAK